MKNILVLLILFITILTIISCTSAQTDNSTLRVVVSVLPQKAFVKAVGGDLVEISEMIPPGGSPATYEPRPEDLIRLERADIYFRIGHIPFEAVNISKFIELNPKLKIIDTSSQVKLRYFNGQEAHEHDGTETDKHGHEKQIDPHIWLAPLQVKKQIDVIAETLVQQDPPHAAIYLENAAEFKAKLDSLHAQLQARFRTMKSDRLLVFHPAWGYFAEEYGLQQIAIEKDGKEPTAEGLQEIIDLARRENIKVIFIQSQFNAGIAASIAEEIEATVISIDPLSEDYINNLKLVAEAIAENLN